MSIWSEDELCDALSEEYEFATEPTDEMNCCTYTGDIHAESGFAETCVGLDGRVKTANFIITGDNCKDIY